MLCMDAFERGCIHHPASGCTAADARAALPMRMIDHWRAMPALRRPLGWALWVTLGYRVTWPLPGADRDRIRVTTTIPLGCKDHIVSFNARPEERCLFGVSEYLHSYGCGDRGGCVCPNRILYGPTTGDQEEMRPWSIRLGKAYGSS